MSKLVDVFINVNLVLLKFYELVCWLFFGGQDWFNVNELLFVNFYEIDDSYFNCYLFCQLFGVINGYVCYVGVEML